MEFWYYDNKDEEWKVDLGKFLDSLEPLDSMSSVNLMIRLSTLSTEDVDKALKRENIRNKLVIGLLDESKKDFYAGFRKIATYFTVEQIFSLFDVQTLRNYFSGENRGHEYKLFVTLMDKDATATLKYILNNDDMFDEFFKQSNYFYSLFADIDYELIRDIILKMGDNITSYPNDFINVINSDSQAKLLKENISDKMLIHMLPRFKEEVVSKFFCEDSRAFYLFDKFNIKYFALREVRFSNELLKKKEFFNKLKCDDFISFRNVINTVEKRNNVDIIEKRLNGYYDEIISSYDAENDMFKDYLNYDEIISSYDAENDMFKDYLNFVNDPCFRVTDSMCSYIMDGYVVVNCGSFFGIDENHNSYLRDENGFISFLQDATSRKLSEVIIDALFQDNIYNVWLNLREMLRYNSKLSDNEKVILKEREDFYKKILDFDSVHSKEKIELFYKLRDKRVNYMFYDDLRKLKDLSYNMIKEELFDVCNKKNDVNINRELSDKYGVTIYDMRDKEFTMLIRGQYGFCEEYMNRRNCYSIIGNENSASYGNSDGRLIYYGYNSFDNDKVIHVLEQDSFSGDIDGEVPSKYVNRIMTSSEIIKGSTWYSEIDLVNVKSGSGRYTAKRPDYIVFYDNGKCNIEDSIDEARRLNIPIVIIKETKLLDDKKIDISFDKEKDYYIENDSSLLYSVRNGRNGRR